MRRLKALKQFALIFAVLCSIYSCQKDDAVTLESKVTLQQSSTTKSVSASEIPKVMQFLESKSNNRLEFIIDDSNAELGMHRSHEENLSVTTALTDQIKMVTNDYGKSNYTFKLIEEQTKEGVYFLNLVVKEYKDELYMYIAKYVPDINWLSNYTDETSFSSFTGDLYIYNVEGIYVGKIGMLDGVISAFAKHPCPGDGEENDTDNVDNNSGGAGNSGNGTETSSESSSSSSSTGNSSSTGGGGGENITIICGCGPEHSENQIMTGHCTCDTIIITVGNRSMSEALRHPCPNDGVPEECFDAVGDPCPHGCDEDGNCVDDSEEIENSHIITFIELDCQNISENINNSFSSNSPFEVILDDVNNCNEEIDLDLVEDNEKFMCIYNKLTNSQSFKNLFLDTFGDENNNLNVMFELTENLTYNGNSINGLATRQDYTLNENGELLSIDVKIQINKNLFSGSNAKTPFQIARTIIHESIHAYLYVKIINCEQGSELIEFDNLVFDELLNMYFESSCNEPLNQHDFMFDYMLPTMQTILSEIKDDILPENQQEAIESTDFYDLSQAYSGPLTESTPFTWEDFYFYLSTNGLYEANFYDEVISSDPIKVFLRNHYYDKLTNLSKNCYE